MKKRTRYRQYNRGQVLAFPPNPREWLPEGDLAYFIDEVVGTLDLGAIYANYDNARGGQPPYHPLLMVSLLVYSYCMGISSSRKIETATYHLVPLRVLCKGNRGDELPEELRFKQSRLKKIQQAKQALEQEARPPKPPSDKPDPQKQRNFTDPESRIMPSQGKNNFIQGYNCQAAVDETSQIIVAAHVTQDSNDKQQLKPLLEKIKSNLKGQLPKLISADSGYFSEDNCTVLESQHVDGYISTGKHKHGETVVEAAPRGRIPKTATVKQRMSRKLRTKKGRCTYSKRKHIVEPVSEEGSELLAVFTSIGKKGF